MQRLCRNGAEFNETFQGAKLALLGEAGLPVILRDVVPEISWPGYWDLPGGGREGDEDPIACVLRETREELGLEIDPATFFWGRSYGAGQKRNWFFAAPLPEAALAAIRLGDEGQCWQMMSVSGFLKHPQVVPHFKARLEVCLSESAYFNRKTPR